MWLEILGYGLGSILILLLLLFLAPGVTARVLLWMQRREARRRR